MRNKKSKYLICLSIIFIFIFNVFAVDESNSLPNGEDTLSEGLIQQIENQNTSELTNGNVNEEIITTSYGDLIINRPTPPPEIPSPEVKQPPAVESRLRLPAENESRIAVYSDEPSLAVTGQTNYYGNGGANIISAYIETSGISYYKIYLDNQLDYEALIQVEFPNFYWDFEGLIGEHTIRVDGFINAEQTDGEPDISGEAILNVLVEFQPEYSYMYMLGDSYLEVTLNFDTTGTYYLYPEKSQPNSYYAGVDRERIAFQLIDESNNLIMNNIINYSDSGLGMNSPEIKALLHADQTYKLLIYNPDYIQFQLNYSRIEDIQQLTPTSDVTTSMTIENSATYSGSPFGYRGMYSICTYVNDELVYEELVTQEFYPSFTFKQIGDFVVKFVFRNSADMTLPDAKELIYLTCNIHVSTIKSSAALRQTLLSTKTDLQEFYNSFPSQHTLGIIDGCYLNAAYQDLNTALLNTQTVLEDSAASVQSLYNANAVLLDKKQTLIKSHLDITSTYAYATSSYVILNGRTSVNSPIYVKIYNADFRLVFANVGNSNADGTFKFSAYTPLKTNYYAVISIPGSSNVKIYEKGIQAPNVNTTFDAENINTIIISAKNVINFANCTFEVYYTPAELAPITFVKNALTPVLSVGTYGDIEITEVGNGVVKFKVLNTDIPSGKYFTGVVNMLQFESLQQGTGTVFAKIVTQ